MRTSRLLYAVVLAATAGAALPLFAQSGPASGPVARYDMRAGTVSGMAGGMGGMSAASMILGGGGGGGAQHELWLRLGSSNGTTGPKADHFMPTGARLGKSVALVTPRQERGPVDQLPGETSGQRPKGRMLIYWGCGEHAPKGQPVVIDFANLAAGQVPAGLWSNAIPADWGPNLENSKTFGRWPADDGKSAKPDLVADRRPPRRGQLFARDELHADQGLHGAAPSQGVGQPGRRLAAELGRDCRRDRLCRHAVRRQAGPERRHGRHGHVDEQREPPVRRRARRLALPRRKWHRWSATRP